MLTDDYTNEYEDVKKSTKTYEDTDKRFTKEKIEKLPFISEEDEAWHQEHKAIAINGYWYDITNFIEFHPGGNVITRFLKADATSTFYGCHHRPEDILKKRWPIARHTTSKPYLKQNQEINAIYWRLHNKYTEMGLFEPTLFW